MAKKEKTDGRPAAPPREDGAGMMGLAVHLPITLVDESLPVPAYHSHGAAAFDLYARLPCMIGAHEHALVPLNLIVHVPPPFALILAARSSLLRRRGLLVGNGIGLVDTDYRGDRDELQALLYNVRNVPVLVDRGERLVQAFVLPVPRVTFVPLGAGTAAPNRGGFGSTGTHAS